MCQRLYNSAISCPKNVRKSTNVTVAEARFCDPSALVSETVKSVVSGDLTYITRLYVFPSSMFWMLKKGSIIEKQKKETKVVKQNTYKVRITSGHEKLTLLDVLKEMHGTQ